MGQKGNISSCYDYMDIAHWLAFAFQFLNNCKTWKWLETICRNSSGGRTWSQLQMLYYGSTVVLLILEYVQDYFFLKFTCISGDHWYLLVLASQVLHVALSPTIFLCCCSGTVSLSNLKQRTQVGCYFIDLDYSTILRICKSFMGAPRYADSS
jgi:hypothetical protein